MSRGTDPLLTGMSGQVADFRLDGYLGRGGLAVVYLAQSERLNRTVALKVLAPELADDSAFRNRFLHEARAAAAVGHPNLIPVYEAGEADGSLYVAMRYVQGGDARSLLGRLGPLPLARAWNIISQVAQALDAAHAHGLIHRDVKPTNMLLDSDDGEAAGKAPRRADGGDLDHVYLSDFGISKSPPPPGESPALSQFTGTLDYVAPEQIEGSAVDGRADLYSLACAGFELLCGTPPFGQDQGLTVMYAQLYAPPPMASAHRPELPVGVDQVLAKALAKNPADRYPTCGQFADELQAALRLAPGGPGGAAPPPPPGQAGLDVFTPLPRSGVAGIAGPAEPAAQAGPAAPAAPAPGAPTPADAVGDTAPHDLGYGPELAQAPTMHEPGQAPPRYEPGQGPAPYEPGLYEPPGHAPAGYEPEPGPAMYRPGPIPGLYDPEQAPTMYGPGWGEPASGPPPATMYEPGWPEPPPGPPSAGPSPTMSLPAGPLPGAPPPPGGMDRSTDLIGGTGRIYPVPPRRSPGRGRLILAGAVAAVVVIAVVIGFSLSGGSAPSKPAPAASPGPAPSASTLAVRQAAAVNHILGSSAATRRTLVGAINKVRNCRNLPVAVSQIRRVVNRRSAEYRHASALSTAALTQGATVKSDLLAALGASLAADRDYLTWAQQQLSSGCKPASQSGAYHAAVSADGQADASKTAFVQVWNPVAARYGVPQKTPQSI